LLRGATPGDRDRREYGRETHDRGLHGATIRLCEFPEDWMKVELINPEDLPVPSSYHQVAIATGTRLVFVAGQVSEDVEGRLVGEGDFALQARTAFANLGRALAAAGARPEDVARITIYVVAHRAELLPLISAARIAVFGDHRPADTLLGVETLAEPGYLIEVEAIAATD
jgi:enamine deaminase RidA (YjgF/YER057c/UK114 family)